MKQTKHFLFHNQSIMAIDIDVFNASKRFFFGIVDRHYHSTVDFEPIPYKLTHGVDGCNEVVTVEIDNKIVRFSFQHVSTAHKYMNYFNSLGSLRRHLFDYFYSLGDGINHII